MFTQVSAWGSEQSIVAAARDVIAKTATLPPVKNAAEHHDAMPCREVPAFYGQMAPRSAMAVKKDRLFSGLTLTAKNPPHIPSSILSLPTCPQFQLGHRTVLTPFFHELLAMLKRHHLKPFSLIRRHCAIPARMIVYATCR